MYPAWLIYRAQVSSVLNEIQILILQVYLNLMSNRLDELSPEISLLKDLRELKIEGNMLKSLPTVLNEMPELKKLQCEDGLMEQLDPEGNIWEKQREVYVRKED